MQTSMTIDLPIQFKRLPQFKLSLYFGTGIGHNGFTMFAMQCILYANRFDSLHYAIPWLKIDGKS